MERTIPQGLRYMGMAGLVAGPLSLAIATVLQWVLQGRQGPDGMAGLINAERGLWLAVAFISVFGPMLWLAGMPAVAALVPPGARGHVLTLTGTLLMAVGLVAGVGHLALFFGLQTVLADAHPDQEQLTAFSTAADGEPLSTVLLWLFLGAFSAGPILLAIGLRRASLVAVWVPVAAIVMTVAGFAGGVPAGIVQVVALLAVFGAILACVARTGGRAMAEMAGPGLPGSRV